MTTKQRGGVFGRNPTFNDVAVDGTLTVAGNTIPDASTILVDGDIGSTVQAYDADTTKNDVSNTFTQDQTFSSNVGIGTTTTAIAPLDIKLANDRHFLSVYDVQVSIKATNDSGNPETLKITGDNIRFFNPYGGYTPADLEETARFVTQTGDLNLYKGNLILANGNGIDFSATAGTGTSELFSDYEEGIWSPVVSDGTNNATMNASTAGSYTKIGNTVFFRARARVSALGSVSGSVRVTGLPFTVANNNSNYGGGIVTGDGLNITAGQSIMYLTIIGASYLSLYLNDATTGITALSATELSATGDLYFSGQYYV